MSKLSGGERGVLDELWDGGSAFGQEGGEDARRQLAVDVIYKLSAKLSEVLGL